MKKLIALAALCLASPVLAMGTKPNTTTYQPSRAMTDLGAENSALVAGYITTNPSPAEKAAAKTAYEQAQTAYGQALAADKAGSVISFNRAAASFRLARDQACAVLSGC